MFGEELVVNVGCASNPIELEANKSAVMKLFFMRDCGYFFSASHFAEIVPKQKNSTYRSEIINYRNVDLFMIQLLLKQGIDEL